MPFNENGVLWQLGVSNMKRIAYVVFLAFILSSCREVEVSLPVETPTSDIGFLEDEELTEFIATMDEVVQQFETLLHVAEDTPAENLEPVIKEMQGVRQDVANIDTPPSAIATKAALDSYMFSTIQCNFRAYAVEVVEESLSTPKIDYCSLAPDQWEYYNIKMDELVEGD